MSSFAGPFPLAHSDILKRIAPNTPAVYLLITLHEGDPYVRYVGRAEADLTRELLSWVGRYDQYAYQAVADDIAGFLLECAAYHDYGGARVLANTAHPHPPYQDLFCTVCGFGHAGPHG